MRRVLIISPSFVPINAPDLQRVRMSLPHYAENGWEPVVLTVNEHQIDATREPALVATVPPQIRVVRCGALPLSLCRALGIGNLGLRAWLHLFLAGSRLLRREKFDLVFFSNTQFVTFTLGRLWRFLHGVPYIVDLQDPWRTDYYERPGSRPPPGGWKYKLARLQARVLEPWCLRKMSALMSVSSHYLGDLSQRYPWFAPIPSDTIGFGATESDLVAARALPVSLSTRSNARDVVRLVYTGAAGPITPHATSVLFSALQKFRARSPELAQRLRFEFYGTSYAPSGHGVPGILPVAQKHAVDDLVRESTDRIGHLESIRLQMEADALLLLGSSDLAYSPSKLYPYYLSARPMLAVVFKDSVLEKLIGELGCAEVASFSDSENTERAEASIIEFFQNLLSNETSASFARRRPAEFRERFLAPALTRRQCELFNRALIQAEGSTDKARPHA